MQRDTQEMEDSYISLTACIVCVLAELADDSEKAVPCDEQVSVFQHVCKETDTLLTANRAFSHTPPVDI